MDTINARTSSIATKIKPDRTEKCIIVCKNNVQTVFQNWWQSPLISKLEICCLLCTKTDYLKNKITMPFVTHFCIDSGYKTYTVRQI